MSLRGISANLVALARTRVELFALETAEEKSRLLGLLGMAAVALLFLFLALLVLSCAIALAVWPTEYRYLALVCLAFLYAALGGVFVWKVRRALAGQKPYAATLEVLGRDLAAFSQAKNGQEPHA